MANYHILKKTADNRFANVYVHLPVPATQTVAGVALDDATLTYQRAMKESLDDTISVVPGITGAEQTQLDNSELVEKRVSFRFSSTDLTNIQRRAEVENGNDNEPGVIQMLADIIVPGTELWNEVLAPLEWWGYYRDV